MAASLCRLDAQVLAVEPLLFGHDGPQDARVLVGQRNHRLLPARTVGGTICTWLLSEELVMDLISLGIAGVTSILGGLGGQAEADAQNAAIEARCILSLPLHRHKTNRERSI